MYTRATDRSEASFERTRQGGFLLRITLIIFIGIFLCAWAVRSFLIAPPDFPQQTYFAITSGESLGGVASRLHEMRLVRSPEAFKLIMLVLGSERSISEGTYYFDQPVTALEIAVKISGREFGILQHKITFPEGFTNKEITARLVARIEGFDEKTFTALIKNEQGYLFPDTYSFSPGVSPQEVVTELKNNFTKKTAALESDFLAATQSKQAIVIMASILEKEANPGEESAIVSGILWKRIRLGIPLQVDASLYYLLGKTSAELTAKDLSIDSPYNTYKYKGLVPAPINNPGLAAIDAALHPKESPYLYYLHDNNGIVHYARTHDEHVANKQKYLP